MVRNNSWKSKKRRCWILNCRCNSKTRRAAKQNTCSPPANDTAARLGCDDNTSGKPVLVQPPKRRTTILSLSLYTIFLHEYSFFSHGTSFYPLPMALARNSVVGCVGVCGFYVESSLHEVESLFSSIQKRAVKKAKGLDRRGSSEVKQSLS